MVVRRKFNPHVVVLLVTLCALLISVVGSVSAQAQPAVCRDAAGGIIPCPPTAVPPRATVEVPTVVPVGESDRDGDGIADAGDRCPDQAGTAETGGCPVEVISPTAAPEIVTVNSVRPPQDGACQITAATTTPSNIRATPSLNGNIVGALDPNQVYPVLSIVVNTEGTWYRIETGWVSAGAATIGGKCPARIVASGPSNFSIAQADYDQATGGISPEEKCNTVFNGLQLCQTVLTATAEDGVTEGTVPWNVNVCGTGPGGIQCTNIRLTAFVEDECPPEFCEPPSNPLPTDWPPGWPNGAPAGSCEALLTDLAAQTEATGINPHYVLYQPNNRTTFGVIIPPVDPQPCQLNVYLPRTEAATDGLIPLDVLTLEMEIPFVPTGAEYVDTWGSSDSFFDDGSTGRVQVRILDAVRYDLSGTACIPTTHGDFTYCPGEPAPVDRVAAPVEPTDPFINLDRLMSFPQDEVMPDGYTCDTGVVIPGSYSCKCKGLGDCINMFTNACTSLHGACNGDSCICAEGPE